MGDNITEYNGSSVIAMAGKGCICIGCDHRFSTGRTTQDVHMKRVFKINPKVFIGLSGLVTDVDTLHETLVFHHQLYKLRENRDMSPEVFMHLVCNLLYQKRWGPYFVQPIVAGLDKDNKPYINTCDFIGADQQNCSFAAAGTGENTMLGVCEAFHRDGMNPEELFEATSQALLAGIDRDSLSGWGGVIHIITPTQIITRELKSRMD